jgi:hypothetical protein
MQSLLGRRPVISQGPSAREASMRERWEMLLSPGTVIFAVIGWPLVTRYSLMICV